MYQIAIDGPSGAGKSTLAKALARELGILYLDTGAMYRAIGLWAVENGISTKDECAIARRLDEIDLRMEYDSALKTQTIFLSDRDVSGLIRTQEISMAASDVSALPPVRAKLVAMQRKIAEGCDIVLDGRDIGTNVLPNARYKFFITASARIRAQRRHFELMTKGIEIAFEEVLEDVQKRDKQDSERALNPLRPADDALIIDTSDMDALKVLDYVLARIN